MAPRPTSFAYADSVDTSATTGTLNLSITCPAPTVTTEPADPTVVAGGTVTFTAAASGTPAPTVQWEVSTDNGATFNDIAGATAATYSFTATTAESGDQYERLHQHRRHGIYRGGHADRGDRATVTTNPTDQTVLLGSTATFTAAASGNPTPSVQWEVSIDGGNSFNPIPGATSTTLAFTTNAAENTDQYEALFTNTAGTATTTAAALTVATISTVAGGGNSLSNNVLATTAELSEPRAIAEDNRRQSVRCGYGQWTPARGLCLHGQDYHGRRRRRRRPVQRTRHHPRVVGRACRSGR